MQVLHIGAFERNVSIEHCVEDHPSAPHINSSLLVALLTYDFWGDISRRSTLIMQNHLVVGNELAHPEVSYFDVTLLI